MLKGNTYLNMTNQQSFSRKLFLLIISATIIRCLVAAFLNLGNDEVYYFTYALQPDWNHFDHPPLVGLFIRFFTLNLHWSNQFTMRLTAIIGAGINTWLIAQCGRLLRNERAGFIAAILYTASIYTSIIAGIFILPDSPQVVFWMMALWVLIKLIQNPQHTRVNNWLLLFGLLVGITTMCKVHGIFLWFGFGIYILLYDRKWLSNRYLYLSIFITLICISPIFIWNYYNDFITWRFHSSRVSMTHASFNTDAFITATIGQIAYNNPINVVLSCMAVIAFIKRKYFIQRDIGRLLLTCALPIIFVTTGISLFRDVLPHWSGPGFMTLLLPTAAFIENKITEGGKIIYKKILDFNVGLIASVLIIGLFIVQLYPGTMGNKTAPELGANDVTLDMYGWKTLKPAFEKIREKDVQDGQMQAGAALIVNKWFPAGHLLFYVAEPLHMRVIGVGQLDDLHKFVWLNKQMGFVPKGGDAYFISTSNYYSNPKDIYKNDFLKINLADSITQYRGGKVARYWYIYQLKGATRNLSTQLDSL